MKLYTQDGRLVGTITSISVRGRTFTYVNGYVNFTAVSPGALTGTELNPFEVLERFEKAMVARWEEAQERAAHLDTAPRDERFPGLRLPLKVLHTKLDEGHWRRLLAEVRGYVLAHTWDIALDLLRDMRPIAVSHCGGSYDEKLVAVLEQLERRDRGE